MSKSINYTQKAKEMLDRGIKYAKDGKILEKQLEFARAYVKLIRTANAATKWTQALTDIGAAPQILELFANKVMELSSTVFIPGMPAEPAQQATAPEDIAGDISEAAMTTEDVFPEDFTLEQSETEEQPK